jgi:fucose permease
MSRTLPIFLTFLIMGIADAMGPMADAVKKTFALSDVVATLLPFFVFIAFAVFSVPGGVLAARIGKKNVLSLGLALSAAALLVPSLVAPSFVLLLACIFVLGIGTALLQVAGNPIMRDVSPEGAYSRNLSLAQGIKGVGSFSSTYLVGLVGTLPLFAVLGWRGAFPVFTALIVVALLVVLPLKVEETKADDPPGVRSSLGLLKLPTFALAVLGIFLYVGAEVCMARFLKPTMAGFGLAEDQAALFGPAGFFLLLTIGRLVGGAVLTVMKPRGFFRLSAAMGLLGAVLLMAGGEHASYAGVALAGLGFANIWPLLFSITVEEMPERSSELSGLMCMAIAGGAVVPLVMGALLDLGLGSMSYLVPAAAFAYLLALAAFGGRRSQST